MSCDVGDDVVTSRPLPYHSLVSDHTQTAAAVRHCSRSSAFSHPSTVQPSSRLSITDRRDQSSVYAPATGRTGLVQALVSELIRFVLAVKMPLVAGLLCVHLVVGLVSPISQNHDHVMTNDWHVSLTDDVGEPIARYVAERNGFKYISPVSTKLLQNSLFRNMRDLDFSLFRKFHNAMGPSVLKSFGTTTELPETLLFSSVRPKFDIFHIVQQCDILLLTKGHYVS